MQTHRPISLTCISCKYLNTNISSSITNHLNTHNIIRMEQHGFRKHCSCETKLLETIHELSSNLNANIQTDFLLLDFSKLLIKCLTNDYYLTMALLDQYLTGLKIFCLTENNKLF